ncbi:MAG: hypothetical protein JEZ06_05970 [Anaerolineaceae bacterium]|nr:hypothetical protein [Anaerolineaceae bacterium]
MPRGGYPASSEEVKEFVVKNFILIVHRTKPAYQVLQVPESKDGFPIVNPFLLWSTKRLNIDVHIWTINEPEEILKFIKMGGGMVS